MRRIIIAIQTVILLTFVLPSVGFYAQDAVSPSRTFSLEISKTKIGQFEKLEMDIHINSRYDNPFDPAVIDLTVLLKTPSDERVTLPAFYCQSYERRKLDQGRNKTNWYYPVGRGTWKARFAPMQTGAYSATARLKDRTGITESNSIRFECVRSSSKGFLRTFRKDRRFLEFTDGTPFFAIGQNLAFIGESQYVNLTKAEEIFGKLSANGANFLRIWTCCEDWAMAIEARKSAWDRSWHRNAPIESLAGRDGPGNRRYVKIDSRDRISITVSPSHPVALKPKTRYALTGRFMAQGPTALKVTVGRNNWELPLRNNPTKSMARIPA